MGKIAYANHFSRTLCLPPSAARRRQFLEALRDGFAQPALIRLELDVSADVARGSVHTLLAGCARSDIVTLVPMSPTIETIRAQQRSVLIFGRLPDAAGRTSWKAIDSNETCAGEPR